jgi:Rrf2 family protein
MLLSQTSRYALRASVFLAERWTDDRSTAVRDIAAGLDVPRNYLSKILHQLAREGVLLSERGPRGGFRLARAPGEIALAEIVEPLEPAFSERRCLLGRPRCSDDDPCPAHQRWSELAEEATRFLEDTTLADLVRGD